MIICSLANFLFIFSSEKQCRDENGFKCHVSSESHQRQLLLFAEKPGQFLDTFSQEFESSFILLLKRTHGTKRTFANQVYQEYNFYLVLQTAKIWPLRSLRKCVCLAFTALNHFCIIWYH